MNYKYNVVVCGCANAMLFTAVKYNIVVYVCKIQCCCSRLQNTMLLFTFAKYNVVVHVCKIQCCCTQLHTSMERKIFARTSLHRQSRISSPAIFLASLSSPTHDVIVQPHFIQRAQVQPSPWSRGKSRWE